MKKETIEKRIQEHSDRNRASLLSSIIFLIWGSVVTYHHEIETGRLNIALFFLSVVFLFHCRICFWFQQMYTDMLEVKDG